MSFTADISSSRHSRKLTAASIKELSSLIQRAEPENPIASAEVVSALMELLVGGPLDLKNNFSISDPSVLPLLLELLPNFSEPLQLDIWCTLTTIWQQSLSNIQISCQHFKLLEKCLEYLPNVVGERVAGQVVSAIELVGTYCISLKELQDILSYLYTGRGESWAPHSTALLQALSHMSTSSHPDVFFTFSGAPGAALTLPPLTKWPTQSGFTFTTWLRLEMPENVHRENYRPAIYWFRTGRPELGYSAHLVDSTLVVETVSKGRKPQVHKAGSALPSYQWHMVTVSYTHNRMKSSQLSCYLNGCPVLNADVTLPATDDVFDKCFLGSTPVSTADVVFQGQMAAAYLFKEPLSVEAVAALHKLGPGYKSQFKFDAESDVSLTPEERKVLFDGRLSGSIVFSYNAKAVDGQLCLEASPNENRSYFAHSPHATLLEGVSPVKTTTFHNILHSLGGVQALIPLFSKLDSPQDSSPVDYTLCVKVFTLVSEMACHSSSFLLQLVQTNAMELFGYLLERSSPHHLSLQLLSAIFHFTDRLLKAPNGTKLVCQIIETLLFNSALWIRAHEMVQMHLYSRLATGFSIETIEGTGGLYLRDLVDTDQLLFIIRERYGLEGGQHEEERELHAQIRPYLLLIMKAYFTKGRGIQTEDMRAILDYLCSIQNEENLHDVLGLLLALIFEDNHHPGNIVSMFYNEGGINVVTKLLACRSEELTLNSLKLIAMVLHHLPQRELQPLLSSVELLAVVKEKLLSAGQPVTIAMFNTLFEVLVDCPLRKIISDHFMTLDLSHQIKYPRLLAVMIELVCSLHTSHEDWEETDTVMRVHLFSYILSLCSQNNHNCRVLLKLQHWPHWFLMLADQPGAKESDQASLQEMVHKLFHLVLVYGFQEEVDGWKLWVDITAALHTYMVSKDEEDTFQEVFSDSPTEPGSNSTGPNSNSILKVAHPRTDSVDDVDSDLSADSSAVSLGAGVQGSFPDELKVPGSTTSSPLVREVLKSSGQNSPSGLVRRIPSTDSPPSPLFTSTNPFLELGGKVTKFRWTMAHVSLLEELLTSIRNIINKWKRSDSHSDGGSSSKHLRSNVAHLLCLTVDSVIALNGSLRHLLSHSSNPTLTTIKKHNSLTPVTITRSASVPGATMATGSPKVRSILEVSLELEEQVVFMGQLKCLPIETKLRMEMGGVIRQGLRLVLACASVNTIQANGTHRNDRLYYSEEKQESAVLLRDSMALLQTIGLRESSLQSYFESAHNRKLCDLKNHQQLLSSPTIAHLKRLIAKDKDNKALLQQMVVLVVFYLATMCVAKYDTILSSREGRTEAPPVESTAQSASASAESSLQSEPGQGGAGETLGFVEDSIIPRLLSVQSDSQDVSEQIAASMELVGPFLCDMLMEHKSLLSKVLVGTDGRVLISDAVLRLAKNKSIVEMSMLLCSQEWQTALKRSGGKLFSDLLSEGKKAAKFSENYLKLSASKMTTSLEQTVNMQAEKFTDFEEKLSVFLSETIKDTNEDVKLRRADIIRHTASAKEQWRKISSVVDEKGFFNFTPLRDTAYWKLDLRENSLRQHLQMQPNSCGSTHDEAVRKCDPVTQEDTATNSSGSKISVPSLLSPQEGHLSVAELLLTEDLLENLIPAEEMVSQLLSVPCCKVMLAHTVPGTLVLTESFIAFTADDASQEYEEALCMEGYCSLNDRRLLEDITSVLSRRYLHQNKALEIFFADRTSTFLVFESSKEVGDMVRRLPKVGVGPHFDLPQARAMSLASPQQLFKKSTMMSKWERREISNFEYLMFLNSIAGRTYNDLNQHPVFPWILKDFSSKELDLRNPDSFRDLTKPMGALTPSRLAQFEERYDCFEDDTCPPFYYGTHYSTMAFVLHWLVRMEPFSTLHINFHDGMFDQSSRLFSSLQDSWDTSTANTSDVNELIPEFFYLPDMFLNSNKFEFGRGGASGEGEVIGDVRLPPWASSVHDFIHLHREALESEHVSSNLHHWIDLIFGYKQRGPEAVAAKNVFYYLTYQGSVDLDSIDDLGLRKGLEEQIRNFGQTPAQLLVEPHPPRQDHHGRSAPQPVQGLNPKDTALLAELHVTPDVPIALVQLSVTRNDLLVVSCNQLYTLNKWIVNPTSAKNLVPTVAIEPDKQIAAGLRVRLGDPLDGSVSSPGACFSTLPNCSVIIVCGFWDNSFKCFDTTSGNEVQSVFGHRHVVSCVDFSPEQGFHAHAGAGLIGTGSHDATVLLWRWSGKHNRVVGSLSQSQAGDALTPVSVCTGHRRPVVCVAVSCSLGVVVSGAKSGSTLVHSTCGELLHNLSPSPHLTHPHLLKVTQSGHLVIHYADNRGCLVVYSCNGELLSQLPLQGPALAMAVSEDGRFLVCGGFDCTVRVFSTFDLRLRHTHPPCLSRIRSLHMTVDQRYIFAGLASGSVVALSTHSWINST